MNFGKKITALFIAAAVISGLLTGCGTSSVYAPSDGKVHYPNEINIVLSDDKITANNRTVYSTVSNIYKSHDVVYYEDRDFYSSGRPYGLGTDEDRHTAEEAEQVTVLNIANAGTYRISGKLSNGQIRVDLSKKARSNSKAVVTIILDNADINCDIAPAIIFKNVFECDPDISGKTATSYVDTSGAGANIIIADGSVNNISGSHVAKIFKDKDGEKKKWKQDGTIYSYMSMNINGEEQNSGVLNVNADFEGISTEKHITINGGNINIIAYNDGINVNDNHSVAAINGGNLHIVAGLSENGGDGIDSNGWIVANGGTTVSVGVRSTDSGIDDERSCYLNGGTLLSFGSHIDWAELDSEQTALNLQFKNDISTTDSIIVTDLDGNVVFAYDGSKDSIIGQYPFPRIGVVISSPQFNVGENYNLYLGGDIYGEEYYGVYNAETVSGFENASLQGHYLPFHKSKKMLHGGYQPSSEKIFTPHTEFDMNETVAGFALITDAE